MAPSDPAVVEGASRTRGRAGTALSAGSALRYREISREREISAGRADIPRENDGARAGGEGRIDVRRWGPDARRRPEVPERSRNGRHVPLILLVGVGPFLSLSLSLSLSRGRAAAGSALGASPKSVGGKGPSSRSYSAEGSVGGPDFRWVALSESSLSSSVPRSWHDSSPSRPRGNYCFSLLFRSVAHRQREVEEDNSSGTRFWTLTVGSRHCAPPPSLRTRRSLPPFLLLASSRGEEFRFEPSRERWW
mmetsp:Transcript_38271/g.114583  ORF Transcript_38271/g.114583 Transcript_38271/m.114583 type:complete len:249 (+) Transcript_38271:238-984(+)